MQCTKEKGFSGIIESHRSTCLRINDVLYKEIFSCVDRLAFVFSQIGLCDSNELAGFTRIKISSWIDKTNYSNILIMTHYETY